MPSRSEAQLEMYGRYQVNPIDPILNDWWNDLDYMSQEAISELYKRNQQQFQPIEVQEQPEKPTGLVEQFLQEEPLDPGLFKQKRTRMIQPGQMESLGAVQVKSDGSLHIVDDLKKMNLLMMDDKMPGGMNPEEMGNWSADIQKKGALEADGYRIYNLGTGEVIEPKKIPFKSPTLARNKYVGQWQSFVNRFKSGYKNYETTRKMMANELGMDPEQRVEEIAILQAEIQGIKSSEAYDEFQKGNLKRLITDPFEVIGQITAESISQFLPAYAQTAIATVPAGIGVGAAIGGGTTMGAGAIPGAVTGGTYGLYTAAGIASLSMEYSGMILETMGEHGVDVTNPDELYEAFKNEELMSEARTTGLKKGIPIALIDMLSAGVAGKVGKIAEVPLQMALGAGGEVAGSVVAGKEINAAAVLSEAFGEVGTAAPSGAINIAVSQNKALQQAKFNKTTVGQEIIRAREEGVHETQTLDMAEKLAKQNPEVFEEKSVLQFSEEVREITADQKRAEGIDPEEFFAGEGLKSDTEKARVLGSTLEDNGKILINLYKGANANTVVEEFYGNHFRQLSESSQQVWDKYFSEYMQEGGKLTSQELFEKEGTSYYFGEQLDTDSTILNIYRRAKNYFNDMFNKSTLDPEIRNMYEDAGFGRVEEADVTPDAESFQLDTEKEFAIWGIPPGKTSEELLYTKAKSQKEADKVLQVLTSKHGIQKGRVQVLDLAEDPSKFWKSGEGIKSEESFQLAPKEPLLEYEDEVVMDKYPDDAGVVFIGGDAVSVDMDGNDHPTGYRYPEKYMEKGSGWQLSKGGATRMNNLADQGFKTVAVVVYPKLQAAMKHNPVYQEALKRELIKNHKIRQTNKFIKEGQAIYDEKPRRLQKKTSVMQEAAKLGKVSLIQVARDIGESEFDKTGGKIVGVGRFKEIRTGDDRIIKHEVYPAEVLFENYQRLPKPIDFNDFRDKLSIEENKKKGAWLMMQTLNFWLNKDNSKLIPKLIEAGEGDVSLLQKDIEKGRESFQLAPKQKEYFKDTKVVDDKGDPLVVYHGTAKTFSRFGDEHLTESDPFFFTPSPEVASGYARNREFFGGGNAQVIPSYINLTNPLLLETNLNNKLTPSQFIKLIEDSTGIKLPKSVNIFDYYLKDELASFESKDQQDFMENIDKNLFQYFYNNPDLQTYLKSIGYDGIEAWEVDPSSGFPTSKTKDSTVYITFRPEQIKSVFNQKPKETGESFQLVSEEVYQEEAKKKKPTPEPGLWSQVMIPISTRLKRINPKLKKALRDFEFGFLTKIRDDRTKVEPFLKKLRKLSDEDYNKMDLALKNSDADMAYTIALENDIEAEWNAVRELLEDTYKRAKDAGLEMGYIDEYFPRKVDNYDGLMASLDNKTQGAIEKAIADEQVKQGRDLTIDEKGAIVNQMIMRPKGKGGKPGHTKKRSLVINQNINQFYLDPGAALTGYIDGMNEAIAVNNYFGKGTDKSDSIGNYVAKLVEDGEIKREQQEEVLSVLRSRFQRGANAKGVATAKNIAYIATMGSPTSAITQFGDLAWSLYEAGWYRTGKAMARSIARQSKLTKKDIGIEKIAAEFDTQSKTATAVDLLFKSIGLTAIDALGKETLINAAIDKYQYQAKRNNPKLKAKLREVFGDETPQVMKDLKSGKMTENVKMLAFNTLLDFQPAALSEMPQSYLNNSTGYNRIFYQLKTFTIKQLDVFRNEAIDNMKSGNPKQAAEGFTNMIKLGTYFVLANATADALKDLIMGREIHLDDIVIDNMFRLAGGSRFMAWQVRQHGPIEAVTKQVLGPQWSMATKIWRDGVSIFKAAFDEEKTMADAFKNIKSVNFLPYGGKAWYWWSGGGSKKVVEQELDRYKSIAKGTRFRDKIFGARQLDEDEIVKFERYIGIAEDRGYISYRTADNLYDLY